MGKKKALDRPFGNRDKFGYMMGDFGCNMSFQLISSWFMVFVTLGCGLDLKLFMALIITAKVFDAINDPIIGKLIDKRKPGKGGKYKPWIFWGAIAIAFTTALMFVDVSSFGQGGMFAYFLVTYMLWSIAYTCANVPYGSLNAALTDDPGERSSLSSLRSIGAGLAMLPIVTLVDTIAYKGRNKPDTLLFFIIAVVCGLVGILGFLITIFMTKEKPYDLNKRIENISYLTTLKNFFKNRSVVALSLASLIQLICILSYSATVPYVYKYYFYEAIPTGMANILIMVPMMIFIPFMGKLSTKIGKKEICSWPNLIGIGVFAIILIVQLTTGFSRDVKGAWIYTVLYMIGMMASGTFMLATWSMVADCVDEQEVLTGKREEASVYATYSFARKVAQGVGTGLIALLLSVVGCQSRVPGADEVELTKINTQASVAGGILNIAIILPLIGFVLTFFVLTFMYNLNRKKVVYNTVYLREKHANQADDLTPTRLFYNDKELNLEK